MNLVFDLLSALCFDWGPYNENISRTWWLRATSFYSPSTFILRWFRKTKCEDTKHTPRKTNISRKKGPFEKEIPSSDHWFPKEKLLFRGVIKSSIQDSLKLKSPGWKFMSPGFLLIIPETNVAPENMASQKEGGLPMINLQVLLFVSRRVPFRELTYPTEREKENHLQNWFCRVYVSSQEGSSPLLTFQLFWELFASCCIYGICQDSDGFWCSQMTRCAYAVPYNTCRCAGGKGFPTIRHGYREKFQPHVATDYKLQMKKRCK